MLRFESVFLRIGVAVVALVFAFCSRGPVYSQGPDESKKRPVVTSVVTIPDAIHQAMQSRDHGTAIKAIETELGKAKTPHRDYLFYLKGLAHAESDADDLRDDAVETFLQLEADFPKSEWIPRSRFARAAIAVTNREYKDAGEIYRAEAERLLSRGRKDELSQIYLEFADRYFDGIATDDPSKERKPDFGQSLEYYREAVKLGPSIAARQNMEFRIARCIEEQKDHGKAITAYQDFLTQHGDDAAVSGSTAPLAMLSEVEFRLGLNQLAANQRVHARRTWQGFLDKHDANEVGDDLKSTLAKAQYRLAHTYGLPTPATVGDLELAVALAQKFLKQYPEHPLAAKAELEIAQGYQRHRRNRQAVDQLEALIANPNYTDSEHLPFARQMLGQSYLTQKKYDESIIAWKAFLENHPTDPQWPSVQQKIISTEFASANDQFSEKEYVKARELWQTFLNKYPLDGRAASILYQFGQMNYLDGQNRHQKRVDAAIKKGQSATDVKINKACKELFEMAIADWGRLVAKYPNSREASTASLRTGQTLEEQLGRRKDALEAYRKVKNQASVEAVNRIARLTQPQLEVRTIRKFRTDEEPSIQLTTRNLENVSISVYSIDMTDYFRKMHLATGVEKLDIALIDPDDQMEHGVEGYEEYKRMEQTLDLPINDAGVWAVTVSSEKQEATTMIVVSDLDIIVKSSRNELFVFAQNMLTGKPASDVSVLVSDGGEVFKELLTDKEGIVRDDSKRLRTIRDLRVFAAHQGHIASTVTNLNGLDFAVGLVPTGYLFTDRPIYRPGELVNVKGIVRWVDQDRFTFTKGEKFTLDIFDPRGRKLKSQTVSLNAFGSINSNLILPESTPPGKCRIHLHRPKSPGVASLSFDANFTVKQYKLESVQLTIETNDTVYFRGTPIKADVKLQYYYGAPLAGETIEYTLGDETQTVKTDDDGTAELQFETQRFSETQTVTLIVKCPQRNVSQSHTVFLATRGFGVSASTARKVFIAGESFDVGFAVNQPSGDPVATDLKVELFEVTHQNGSVGERLVKDWDAKSDDESGKANQTMSVDQDGLFIVRATGVDQFGNQVSGQTRIQISGNEDTTRLRVLSEKHSYQVGEDAIVRLHWRESSALALVTFDGASVLGHRLVKLKKGDNKLRIPMEAKLAPNFTLSAAVMQRNKFHQATSHFVVAKKLLVKLTPSKSELKPMENVTVDIEVTDASGKPVAVELSLAMIQAGLLDRFMQNGQSIESRFGHGLRKPSVRQVSSCTFSYSTSTRDINGAVLAESHRRSRRLNESAAMGDLFGGSNMGGGVGGGGLPHLGFGDASSSDDIAVDRMQNGNGGVMLNYSVQVPYTEQTSQGYSVQVPYTKQAEQAYSVPVPNAEQSQVAENGQTRFRAEIRRRMVPQTFQRNERRSLMLWPSTSNQDLAALGLQRRDVTINALTNKGQVFAINGWQAERVQLVAVDGVRLIGAASIGETGFWDPAIVTDEKGKASVEITMPAQSTAWRLQAQAISQDALGGQGTADLVTRKTLFGQLKTPMAFTDGDESAIEVEVHNSLPGKREIKVTLSVATGDDETKRTSQQTKTITVDDADIKKLSFPVKVVDTRLIDFQLTVSTDGEEDDVTEQSIPVLPYGFTVYQTASGTASQNTLSLIGLKSDLKAKGQSLELLIGGNVNGCLIESMTGGGQILLPQRCIATGLLSRSASDCMAGVAVLEMIRGSNQDHSPQSVQISDTVAGAISNLIAAQRDDGGWSIVGSDSGRQDALLTARIMWALSKAKEAGFSVPNEQFEKGKAAMRKFFAATPDLNRQAILLNAMASSGGGDFSYANRLYRERNRLSEIGMVHLMLALSSLNHDEMAAELIDLVKVDAVKGSGYSQGTPVELAALQLLALQAIDSRPAQRQQLATWLLSKRAGSRWAIESENGPAIAALAAHHRGSKPNRETVKIAVSVNGNPLRTLTLPPGAASARLEVPKELLVEADEQQVEFRIDGRGAFSYSAVLTGFAAADDLASTTKDWSVSRRYEPDTLRHEGKEIPRGFRVINGSYQRKPNTLTQVPVGQRVRVTLSPRVRYTGQKHVQAYLMLIEPIPSGCTVLEESIAGTFDRYEITPGAITFYLGEGRRPNDIRYTLAGYSSGKYRIAPAVLRNYYSPGQIAVSTVAKLEVLPADQESQDEYKLTPDERYHLGKAYFAKGDHEAAHHQITELFENWTLDAAPYKESVTMLFHTSMHLNSHAETIRYFEIIKERFPEVELSFEEILNVAASYREIEEYERSYLVYRATVQGSFERENQVAGFLDARGEFLRSVQTAEKLMRDYPGESYVATANYALAQEVYRRAASIADDKKLLKSEVGRVDLINGSIHMLDHFLTNWSADPSTDQASFALATALIELDQYKLAIQRSQQYAKRYANSPLLDSFWYIIGFCYFELQDHQKALEMCRQVAEAKLKDPVSGLKREADNKWEAIYIMGQIYHSLGEAAQAIDEYTKVEQRFSDAAEAIEFFSRKSIELSDVTTLAPGDDKEVVLNHRNLPEAFIKVYRIDLMKFGLTQRNLDRITAINLAGIKPYHQETVKLGDGKDYRDRETTLALPLEEQGAYLVVCRGENLYASGLVVVSPLAVTVQEDIVSGRVRVTVKDTIKDQFIRDVHVKVIGSGNDEFKSGQTDLRGLFIADEIRGTSTVISVSKDNQYAFHRGSVSLLDTTNDQVEQGESSDPFSAAPQAKGSATKSGKGMLLDNVFRQNSVFQLEQKGNYDNLNRNNRNGVKSKEAY